MVFIHGGFACGLIACGGLVWCRDRRWTWDLLTIRVFNMMAGRVVVKLVPWAEVRLPAVVSLLRPQSGVEVVVYIGAGVSWARRARLGVRSRGSLP